jgi:hypothetical protein
MHRGLVAFATGACLLGVLAPAASASRLVDRNAAGAALAVSRDGKALVTYTVAGKVRHVLAACIAPDGSYWVLQHSLMGDDPSCRPHP